MSKPIEHESKYDLGTGIMIFGTHEGTLTVTVEDVSHVMKVSVMECGNIGVTENKISGHFVGIPQTLAFEFDSKAKKLKRMMKKYLRGIVNEINGLRMRNLRREK